MRRDVLGKLVLLFCILYVLVPLSVPIIYSFSQYWTHVLPKGFTLEWYKRIFTNPNYQPSLFLSLYVASLATILNIIVVVPAAYAVNKLPNKFAIAFEYLFKITPLIFPPLIVGLGILQAFNRPPLMISGTVTALVVGHALLGFPFMFRNVYAVLKTIDEVSLSEAAANLGANLFQRLIYVIVPNVMPGILAGALLTFAISFGEFEVTSMIVGFMSQTLPLVLFQELRNNFRVASAATAVLVYVSLMSFIIITLITTMYQRRKGI
ncbi:ABC transporter permease [Pseudothermotoga sp.]